MRRILLVLALVACGGGTQRAPAPLPPTTPTTPTKPVEHYYDELSPKPEPTAEECQRLLQHMMGLSMSERPADQQLSTDEQARIGADMGKALDLCNGVTREIYDCAMAATSTTTMAACDHLTPSSSTSNKSVAPGGMTPPAPRAP